MAERIKCLIIGSGPAGYTAAIYAARADLKPVLYQGSQPGGQLTTTTLVENFPGFPNGIQGIELMENMKSQAIRLGAEIYSNSITKVDFSKRPFILWTDNNKIIEAQAVIIATGAEAKSLGLASEQKFKGYGVSYCATCDGFFFRGKTIAVVGGGDSAAEEALFLSNLCKKVFLIHRRDSLRANKLLQKKIFQTNNIEFVWNHIVIEIVGHDQGLNKYVTGIIIEDVNTKAKKQLDVNGVFIAIGHHPNTEIFKGQLELTDDGYIKTVAGSTKTSIEGVFAAGDVQDKIYRQAITAAASGCMAAIEAEKFLATLNQ